MPSFFVCTFRRPDRIDPSVGRAYFRRPGEARAGFTKQQQDSIVPKIPMQQQQGYGAASILSRSSSSKIKKKKKKK